MDWAASPEQQRHVCLIVTTMVLGLAALGLLIATCVAVRPRKRVSRYYRGEGVRMASTLRRVNMKPHEYGACTFSRVLPGSVSVRQFDNVLQSSVDLRPFLKRGDPVKVGPQLFVVDEDESRPFTDTQVPLGGPGTLRGPNAEGVTVYTCDQVELPGNRYTGPRGGVIGYWSKKGKWKEGYCYGVAPHWYSPLWMGAACEQKEGPSPAQVARLAESNAKAKAHNGDEAD